jgi:hypothetical protein
MLCVFNQHVKVAIFIKNASVKQLKFRVLTTATLIFCYKLVVRIGLMGIFIECFQVGVSRGAVEVEVLFFNVFAVIPFIAR